MKFDGCLFQVIAGCMLLIIFGGKFGHAGEKENTNYINSLNYDLRRLLSTSLEPSYQPPIDPKTEKSGSVVICRKTPKKAISNLTESVLLDPSGGVIFPGALVLQDRHLAEGLPTPLTLPRSPLTIRVDLPGIGKRGSRTIENPSNVTVQNAIDDIVNSWFETTSGEEGYTPIARAFFDSQKAYTKEQIGIQMSFGAQWSSSNASASLDLSESSEQTVVMSSFKQVYFSVYINAPRTSGSVFSDSVVLSPNNVTAAAPPGLVRSVDFGRIIIVQMTTKGVQSQADAEAALNYAASTDSSIEAALKAKYERIINNSQFKAIVLGGSAADSRSLFDGNPANIVEVITAGVVFSKQNPGYPISYKVADLKTRQIAQMKVTTDYVETDCREHKNGFVGIWQAGGYFGKFNVSWKEHDKNGKLIDRRFNSGSQPIGYSKTIFLPGDATNIQVTADRSVFINTWRETINRKYNFPPNRCFKIYGTTLNSKSSIKRGHC